MENQGITGFSHKSGPYKLFKSKQWNDTTVSQTNMKTDYYESEIDLTLL